MWFRQRAAAELIHIFFLHPSGVEQPVPPQAYRQGGRINFESGRGNTQPKLDLAPPIIGLDYVTSDYGLEKVVVADLGSDYHERPVTVDEASLTAAVEMTEEKPTERSVGRPPSGEKIRAAYEALKTTGALDGLRSKKAVYAKVQDELRKEEKTAIGFGMQTIEKVLSPVIGSP